jgi:polar amino acid transport system substrate-binding protein
VNPEARKALPASIISSGKLRVGIDTMYPPNEFRDAGGNPVGWEVDLMHAISQRLGLNLEYHQVPFDTIIPAVQANTLDMGLSSFFDTPERQKLVDLVDYYSAGILWVQKAGSPSLEISNACGLAIAAQKGTYESDTDLPAKSAACVEQNKPAIDIKEYALQNDATDAVSLGRVSAFAADSPVSLFAIKESAGQLTAVGKTYSTLDYGIPVKKGSSLGIALKIVIKQLMQDGTYAKVLNSWGVEDGAVSAPKINGMGN